MAAEDTEVAYIHIISGQDLVSMLMSSMKD